MDIRIVGWYCPHNLYFRICGARDRNTGGEPMNRDYDIFEKLPDGSVIWRAFVPGLVNARGKLHELAARSKNEFFAIHTPTKDIVERVNAARDPNA